MCQRIFLLAVFLAVCLAHSAAQDTQARAQAMLQRARELSDIRSVNASAFRLKATFSFVGKDLETAQGTYTEVWVSNSRWRRETTVNSWRRVEVGSPNRRWLLDSTVDFPDRAARVAGLLMFLPPSAATFAFESISERSNQETVAECTVTKHGSSGEVSAFCFDQKSGLLLQRVFPQMRPSRVVAGFRAIEHSCSYGTFQKLGNYWFPHEILCSEDKHREISVEVTDLSLEPTPDSALFTPPPGAIELADCPVPLKAPKALSYAQLAESGSRDQGTVNISLVVDIKGQPQNLRVIRSAGKILDADALNAVRRWHFQPATCNGEPAPAEITVEIGFWGPQ